MTADRKRAEGLREILGELHQRMGLGFGFRLWDGARVPEDLADDAPAVAIRDEGVVVALVKTRKFDALIAAFADGRVDLVNATLFDLEALRPEGKLGGHLRAVGAVKLARLGARFLLAPSAPVDALRQGEKGGAARDGSVETNRRNIAHHYDVSNDFYRLFLDREMLYSCAYFTEWHDDIDRAQADKLDMICRKLRLKPGDRFLDIGCGWGALVRHAVTRYGVTATGVTLSQEQFDLATARARDLGLADRIDIRFQDYTTLDGEFDKIASIGMFEHVGLDNHARYFQTVRRLLRPRGLYLHHAITRPGKADPRRFKRQPAEYRAILRYIFPGAELDHIGMSVTNLEDARFEVHDVEDWREHYARTTRIWHDRLIARRAEAVGLVGEETVRMWLLYLAGVSLGFNRGSILIYQTLASKRARGPSDLPPTRADLYAPQPRAV